MIIIRLLNNKQFDPAWHMMIGRGTMTMAQGGCGILALANALGLSPLVVGRWMESQGLIDPDQGTTHAGIVLTLRHFGADGQMLTSGYLNGQLFSDQFQTAYNHAAAGYVLIFLMGGLETRAGGQCRNSYWSNAGHYITVFMTRDGKLYVYDPASYARDGWHSITDTSGWLTDSFNGNVKKIWLTNIKWTEGETGDMGIPTVAPGSRGKHVKSLQILLNAAGIKGGDGRQLKEDGDAGSNTVFAINSYQAIRRSQGVELGTDGKNDSHCGDKMWHDIIVG